uniref:Uncharacterized protein n=1 Tax=Romanomermis culicivorax TaxID=13658 RepID=A0A915KWY0_ROMCU
MRNFEANYFCCVFCLFITSIYCSCYAFEGDFKDPCEAQNCLYGSNCVLSPDGKSGRCVCAERCYNYGDSKGSRPVCGQDGRDYASLCHIRK